MADPDLGVVLYRVDGSAVEPEVVVLEGPNAAPERLIERGDHYEDVAEAWAWLERESNAHLSLIADEIQRLRDGLSRTEREAADVVIRSVEIRKRYAKWKGTTG